MNIVVLTGGTSAERNVSLASGQEISKTLRESGHTVKVVDPVYGSDQPAEHEIFTGHSVVGQEFPSAKEINTYSNRKVIECINSSLFDKTDIVFLGLHGKFGEDGRIQSLLEMRGLKYTGSGITSSAMAMDKDVSKILFTHYNIPTAPWFMLEKNHNGTLDIDSKIKEHINYPAVIKPNDEGSTVGLSIVQPDVEDVQLESAINSAFEYSGKVMVEQFIAGRELTVAILGEEALPVIEIRPKDGYYDYEHKYTKGMTEYICPAELSKSLADELREKSLIAHKALGCKVYSRVDFRMNSKDEYFCLEVNTLPGMTETSLVPKAAKAVNISFPQLLNKIIELSLK